MAGLRELCLREKDNSNEWEGAEMGGITQEKEATQREDVEARGVRRRGSGAAIALGKKGPVWRGVNFTQRPGLNSSPHSTPRLRIEKPKAPAVCRWE